MINIWKQEYLHAIILSKNHLQLYGFENSHLILIILHNYIFSNNYSNLIICLYSVL